MAPIFVVSFAVLLVPIRAGWETPLEGAAKISTKERDQLAQDAELASQRASAQTRMSALRFLALDAEVQQPCQSCDDKDFSDPCPLSWNQLTDARCEAPSSYEGECARVQAFLGAPAASKMEFEITCGVCWPCSKVMATGSSLAHEEVSTDVKRGEQAKAAGFLAARVLPVDGYRIRNSLFLSQLLRTPAAAAINVVENEDAARVLAEAKYKAMQGQIARSDRALESKLLLLSKAL